MDGVVVARGEVERVGDDHRLAALDDVDGDQRGIQRGDVVAVAQFRGKRTAVFESDGVLVGIHQTDSRGGGFTQAESGIEQDGQDSGNRIGGVQRGVELG